MSRLQIIGLIILISALSIILYIYTIYKEEIVFSPSIFFTETSKFIAITVCWTIILEFYRKSNSEKRRSSLKDLLLISKIDELLLKIEGNSLKNGELLFSVAIVNNNITLMKSYYTTIPESIKKLSDIEGKIGSDKNFENALQYIELQLKNQNDYRGSIPYETVVNELKEMKLCILKL